MTLWPPRSFRCSKWTLLFLGFEAATFNFGFWVQSQMAGLALLSTFTSLSCLHLSELIDLTLRLSISAVAAFKLKLCFPTQIECYRFFCSSVVQPLGWKYLSGLMMVSRNDVHGGGVEKRRISDPCDLLGIERFAFVHFVAGCSFWHTDFRWNLRDFMTWWHGLWESLTRRVESEGVLVTSTCVRFQYAGVR